ECIREGILKEFLLQNRAEVMQMSIFEYDQEAHMRMVRKEGWEEGRADANTELILNMHRNNFTLEQIALATQKSIDEIQAIIEEKEVILV
ncbi:MAG: hypothetical protein J6I65_01765, partial [Lachnospiraceae bacterium]|nr:hypothetical protein [Lachnospiraceae bacterium]